MTFDFAAFFDDHLPNASAVIDIFVRHGATPPDRFAVRKWRQRDAIPGEWFPQILYLLEKQDGAPVDIARYMRGTTT